MCYDKFYKRYECDIKNEKETKKRQGGGEKPVKEFDSFPEIAFNRVFYRSIDCSVK